MEYLRILPEHRELLVDRICETPKIKRQRKSYHKIIEGVIEGCPKMQYVLKYLNLLKKKTEKDP